MAKMLTLAGTVTVDSIDGSTPSGAFNEVAQLAVSMGLANGVPMADIVLASDAAVVVAIPTGMTAVNAVIAQTVGGEATLQFTSSKGTDQSVPVNPLAVVTSETTSITGLKLVRQAGVSVTVRLFLGEKSS